MVDNLSLKQLIALYEIGQAIGSQLTLEKVLKTVMDVATKVMHVEASSLILLDEQSGELVFYIAEGEKASRLKAFRMQPGQGIVGHVVQNNEPAIVNDAQSDPRFFKKADKTSGFVTKSILCVPMATKNKLWGAIEVLNKQDDADFDQSDLIFLQAMSKRAALAVENAMLHEDIVKNERLAAVGQTVAGLAHCIKNVLNGIQGGSYLVDMGLKKNNPTLIDKGWTAVKKNNTFMQDLVLDMLTYSKEREPEYIDVDINELAQTVCDFMKEKAASKGISLLFEPNAEIGNVQIDGKAIKRSLLNLVSNAVDACENRPDAKVEVSLKSAAKDFFAILVSDNGSGIPPEAQKKLFQVFFSTKGSKGTGLGLAVTHKIIEEHGGRIDVDSEIDKGTTFTIFLPKKKQTLQRRNYE